MYYVHKTTVCVPVCCLYLWMYRQLRQKEEWHEFRHVFVCRSGEFMWPRMYSLKKTFMFLSVPDILREMRRGRWIQARTHYNISIISAVLNSFSSPLYCGNVRVGSAQSDVCWNECSERFLASAILLEEDKNVNWIRTPKGVFPTVDILWTSLLLLLFSSRGWYATVCIQHSGCQEAASTHAMFVRVCRVKRSRAAKGPGGDECKAEKRIMGGGFGIMAWSQAIFDCCRNNPLLLLPPAWRR